MQMCGPNERDAALVMIGWQGMRQVFRKVLRGDGSVFALLQTMITQILVVVLNMASGIMTARLLGAEGRGIFAATTVWPQFLAYTSFVGLPVAFVYCLKEAPGRRGTTLTAAMMLGLLFSSVAVVAGIIIVPFYMKGYSPETVALAQFCVLGTYAQFFNAMLRQALVGFGLFTAFNLSSYLAPFLYVLSMLTVWATIGLTAANSAACLLLTIMATNVWIGWKILRVCRPRLRSIRDSVHDLLSYSARASMTDILSGLMSSIDRLVLISFITPAALGSYAVAYSFSRLIQLLQVGVIMVLFPTMTGRSLAEVKILHDHALRFMSYAVVLVVAALLAVGPRLLVLIYGPDFGGITFLCDILFIEAGVSCVCTVIMQLYMSTGNPGYASIAQAVSFIATVGFMLCLVPPFGAVGTAISLLASTVIRLVVLWAGIAFRLRIGLPRLRLVRSDLDYLRSRFIGQA